MKTIAVLMFFSSMVLCSCFNKSSVPADQIDPIRMDLRYGDRYLSLISDENGKAFMIRGDGSSYLDSFKIITADTSKQFKLDSLIAIYPKLRALNAKPRLRGSIVSDGPRHEVYFGGKKIYDDKLNLDLIRPLMGQMPAKFNPLNSKEDPFDIWSDKRK